MFAGKKSAQIREILISESAWEEMTCLFAPSLARWRGCVWHREGLTRQRAGAVQHSLNARQRRQNLKNAFQLEFAVQGLHIALVDDVVTTGSTVAEISRLLLRNGAATVQVWCLCRTL